MIRYFLFLGFVTGLYADTGCQAIINNKSAGCNEESILLTTEKKTPLEVVAPTVTEEKGLKITPILSSVEVVHLGEEMTIERVATKEMPSCPPHCIQPMGIEGIKTVGELETLAFIEKLKEKKSRLVIDVRGSKVYKDETIPTAINLPYSMLLDGNPYQKEVLKLLGSGKKMKKRWFFKHPHQLLIFGEDAFSSTASDAILQLIKLGYPKDKILYYRGGVRAWRASGLTLI